MLDRFSTDDDRRAYWPIETGLNLPVEDTLRVELDVGQFPNQMVSKDFPIKVNPIRVTPLEGVIEVDEPGELVPVRVRIEQAHDDALEWAADEGGWQGEPRLVQADPPVWEYMHIAASDEDKFPYVISARSSSTTGLRADGDPPRVATMEVRLRELIIEPDPGSVFVEGRLQFTARDRDGNPVEVNWSATGGSIDANGVYRAGENPGLFQVTAISKENPGRRATAAVEVNEIPCVVGTWKMDNASFEKAMEQLFAESGFPADVRVSGDDYSRFAVVGGDEPIAEFSFLQRDFTLSIDLPDGESSFVINGAQSGIFGTSQFDDDDDTRGIMWINETAVEFERVEAVMGPTRVELDTDASGSVEIFDYRGALPPDVPDLIEGAAAYECVGDDELLLTTSVDEADSDDGDVDPSALPGFMTVSFSRADWPEID